MINQIQARSSDSHSTDGRDSNRFCRSRSPLSLRTGAALLLVLATSCGSGGSADSSGASTGASTDQSTTVAEASADSQAPSSEDAPESTGGTGLGMIEIGGDRHELTITRCFSLSGALGGNGVGTTDPENVNFNFDFSPEDWAERDASEGWYENGSVRLDSDEPYLQWETGPSIFEGINMPDDIDVTELDITSYDIADDNQSVTGEAMFFELNEMLINGTATPTPGTFSFSCPPEG